jgi:hypothetical protein
MNMVFLFGVNWGETQNKNIKMYQIKHIGKSINLKKS